MYCDIKGVECANAGQCCTFGCEELGEAKGFHVFTICYNEGGQINCDI